MRVVGECSTTELQNFRLIDPKNVRHAWGNQAHCNMEFDAFVASGVIKPHSGSVVIVLHGLMRTHRSMEKLADYADKNGFQSILFQYASGRDEVAEHAARLREVVDSLGPEVTEINFVAHSLGNIVIRHYLADTADSRTGEQGDQRIHRIVMIGPPNQGSEMARLLKNSVLFNAIAGKSGSQLSKSWEELKQNLVTPSCEFGIIAGVGDEKKLVKNFVLQGPSDFTVSLKETRLNGASDFLVAPFYHTTMMHQPQTLEATIRFLKHGYFISEEKQQPIPTTKSDASRNAAG